MDIQKIAAFTFGDVGGNPAGIVLCENLPTIDEMQRIAKEIGFSETAFAAPMDGLWLWPLRHGDGIYSLKLNHADITVEGTQKWWSSSGRSSISTYEQQARFGGADKRSTGAVLIV